MYLVLSALTYSPISLLATTEATFLFYIVCTLQQNTLTSSSNAKIYVPFNFKPCWFT